LNSTNISELTWRDPLASQVISSDSKLVEKLPGKLKKKFMVCISLHFTYNRSIYHSKPKFVPFKEPAEKMVPKALPTAIQEECDRFVLNFLTQKVPTLMYGMFHTGEWKEGEDKLAEVTIKILKTLENIWSNPAFHPEFVMSLNEGSYVTNIIVPLINAALYNNPFGESAFITM